MKAGTKNKYPHLELYMEYMSWTDIRDLIQEGYRTVVFSVGATEQHGPHMPIATDSLLGTATALGVAAELGNSLVAPTIRPGFSPHHMDFPGTITLRHSTLSALIVDYCTSLATHGFEVIIIISSHGGNTNTVKLAAHHAQEMIKETAIAIPITDVIGYWRPEYNRRIEGYHATHLEASRVMAIASDLVVMDRARDWSNPISEDIKDVGTLLGLRPVKFFAPDGTMGRPSGANIELGEESINYICQNIAQQIRIILNHIGVER